MDKVNAAMDESKSAIRSTLTPDQLKKYDDMEKKK
jgi:hypothetical protein